MTAAEQHELSALLGKALGEACYLSLAQKLRLRELLEKQNTEKEINNDNKGN
jgi:hypothetical protein